MSGHRRHARRGVCAPAAGFILDLAVRGQAGAAHDYNEEPAAKTLESGIAGGKGTGQEVGARCSRKGRKTPERIARLSSKLVGWVPLIALGSWGDWRWFPEKNEQGRSEGPFFFLKVQRL